MVVYSPGVRDAFITFLCVTVIGLILFAATINPFLISNAISQALNVFDSPTVSYDSSMGITHLFPMAVDRSSLQSKDRLSSNATYSPAGGVSFQNVSTIAPVRTFDELDRVLAKTANGNKTVIITALNGAWAEPNTMIDLFVESFHIGEGTRELLNNLLIVALDAKAYNRCLAIHPHCYTLKTRGVDFSAEKVYMSQDYLKMMWRRLGFLGDVLRRGYNFVFSDADIMWLRDPFPRLSTDADIQITSDKFNGRPYDVFNLANSGFEYVRSNEHTIGFYRYWYLSRKLFPGQSEQNVLNIIKLGRGFSRGGFKLMFLDTRYFGGFCERSPYIDDVYTMHANCCKGLKAKLGDLRETLDDWSQYRSLPHNTSRKMEWRPPNACLRSWHV